jgi:hypothetical protein
VYAKLLMGFAVTTQGGSPVRESRSPGSVRGVLSNGHSYRDKVSDRPPSANSDHVKQKAWIQSHRYALS